MMGVLNQADFAPGYCVPNAKVRVLSFFPVVFWYGPGCCHPSSLPVLGVECTCVGMQSRMTSVIYKLCMEEQCFICTFMCWGVERKLSAVMNWIFTSLVEYCICCSISMVHLGKWTTYTSRDSFEWKHKWRWEYELQVKWEAICVSHTVHIWQTMKARSVPHE